MDSSTCSVDDCHKPRHGVYHSLCRPHYERGLRRRRQERADRGEVRLCEVEGCSNPHSAKGVCTTHRVRALRAARPNKPKVAKVPKPHCLVDQCAKISTKAGYCSGHYSNLHRHGVPVHPKPRGGAPLERFARRVDARNENGCWLWTGRTNGEGYGRFYLGDGRREVRAHRWFYQTLTGCELPRFIQLDHECNVRHCVRPGHLAEVSQSEHNVRTAARLAAQAAGLLVALPETLPSPIEARFLTGHLRPAKV